MVYADEFQSESQQLEALTCPQPRNLKFSDIPCTIEAIYKVPAAGWLQVFALAGAIEAKNLAFPTNYGALV